MIVMPDGVLPNDYSEPRIKVGDIVNFGGKDRTLVRQDTIFGGGDHLPTWLRT